MKKKRSFAGRVRQGQLLTTYGPGAMMDLPERSVVVGGLSRWRGDLRVISETRLAQNVSHLLGAETQLELRAPPVAEDDPETAPQGVEAMLFPLWFVAQIEPRTITRDGRVFLTRPLVHHAGLQKMRYEYERKAWPVVPVRFVQACPSGHLSDIDWPTFAHHGLKAGCRGPLWLDEGGTGGDFADLFIRCEGCGVEPRKLADAKIERKATLGGCEGRRPWISYNSREACQHVNKLLTRSASNTWFAQSVSALSIPDPDGPLRGAVDAVYGTYLSAVPEAVLPALLDAIPQLADLKAFPIDAVWAEVQRRRQGLPPKTRSLKQAEVETLRDVPFDPPPAALGADWAARRLKLDGAPSWFTDRFDRVVLVERLRLVTAMVGFTRFEPVMPDIEGELDMEVERAPLDTELKWLPAVEIRGEGVFLGVKAEAITAWRQRAAAREDAFADAFERWRAEHSGRNTERPDLAYIMLHALSHALLTGVALECGYATTSLAERVYALPHGGYGILIYTASAGSEGTLGGLVEVGRNIHRHVSAALERSRLCSSDPVCAHHTPDDPYEARWLHGAACHACMLIAEPSCEQRNQFIDRALLVPTVENSDLAFFE
jgi:hypothetical protein